MPPGAQKVFPNAHELQSVIRYGELGDNLDSINKMPEVSNGGRSRLPFPKLFMTQVTTQVPARGAFLRVGCDSGRSRGDAAVTPLTYVPAWASQPWHC